MVSAIVLNWNELEISKDTVRRLLREPSVEQVILVDNGSTDGSIEYFDKVENAKFTFLSSSFNMGSSKARNWGIQVTESSEYTFLIDGDILYVPGTIDEYIKVIKDNPDAVCVGQNSWEMVQTLGHNGATNPIDADVFMTKDYTVSDWFPMAWTQYGLFKADFLRDHPFVTDKCFGEPGHGFEDDWLYHEIKEAGFSSLAVNKPVYYHAAHSGLLELQKAGLSSKTEERRKIFEARWGKDSGWMATLSNGIIEKTQRPNPNREARSGEGSRPSELPAAAPE